MVLEKGAIAPDFTYVDQDGQSKQLHNVSGKKIVMFFPRAFTTTCTKEVCSVQASYPELKAKGITEVFGISTDSASKQAKFSSSYNLEFLMVDDKGGKIASAYGILFKKFLLLKLARRFTFIVNDDNVVEEVLRNGMKGQRSKYGMEKHGEEILELLS